MADPKITADRPIVTRKQAKASGLTRYFIGKPCKHGHIAERAVCDYGCVLCRVTKVAAWHGRNRERCNAAQAARNKRNAVSIAATRAAWRKANSGRVKEAAKRSRERTKDKISARNKAWRAKNPGYSSTRKEYSRAWYLKNKARVLANCSAWQAANPKRRAAIMKRYKDRNPSFCIFKVIKRRARILGAEGQFTSDDVVNIRRMQRDKCAACRRPLRGAGEKDHIVSLARGGSNWPSNIQLLCPPCNRRKSDRDPIEFMRSLGRLI